MVLNNNAKNIVLSNNIKYPNKCKVYDFYLFYLEKTYIKNQIEHEISN